MSKKIIDIFPPQRKEKEKKELVEREKESHFSFKSFAEHKPALPLKKSLVFALFFLILLLGFSYFALPRLWGGAEIEIWPETQVLYLNTELTTDKEAKEIDFLEKVIPAQILEKEKILAETFQASGKVLKETKAEGMIKVYNDHSTSPQVLVATTRFVSSDGKVFRTPVSVTVPGGAYQAGKFVSGEIDIRVVADKPGPEYDIGPSTFSIPGFAGTDRYTKFYAKSFQPMSGGFREEVPKVTKEDIVKAEEFIKKKAKDECQNLLDNELRSEGVSLNFNYLLKESQAEIIEELSSVEPEEELEEFNFQVKARCKILLFEKKDLHDFVRKLIGYQVSEGESLYEESLKSDYFSKRTDLASGKMFLSLNAQAKTYPQIDINSLKNALAKKSLSEARIFLESQSEINKVEIKLWPFWAKRIPEDFNKVEVKIKVEP